MRKALVKYRFLLLALLSSFIFISLYYSEYHKDLLPEVHSFELKFKSKQSALQTFLKSRKKRIDASHGHLNRSLLTSVSTGLFEHIYRNDSLVYWNTNQLPVLRFADIHFPSDGIVHLQNGWYYAEMVKSGPYTICASFLIKHDFPYENQDLVNEFNQEFKFPFNATISLDQESAFAIRNSSGEFMFSLVPGEHQPKGDGMGKILLTTLLITLCLWLFVLFKFSEKKPLSTKLIIPLSLLLLRWISLHFNLFNILNDNPAFEASLYGTNELFPNLFEYLLNCSILFYLVFVIKDLLSVQIHKGKHITIYLLFAFIFPFWAFNLFLSKGLIENSSIPLNIDNLFSLNYYSILAIASIGLLFYAFFIYCRAVLQHIIELHHKKQVVILTLLLGLGYFALEMTVGFKVWTAGLFPTLLISALLQFHHVETKKYQLGYGLFFLLLAASITTFDLLEFNSRKEQSERALYASQLATEEDIITEIEYASIAPKISSDRVLQRFVNDPMNIGLSEFEDGLEGRIFNGYWERYEMSFSLFDSLGNSLISGMENPKEIFDEYNEIISQHGRTSEIDNRISYIADHTGQYSYMIKQPLQRNDAQVAILFITLKSKRIPEEIGFPRLLISSKAQVFNSLEKYSIARYHNNKLIVKYGVFNFPTSFKSTKSWGKTDGNYYYADGYSHYILKGPNNDAVVLSAKNFTWKEGLSSFSYLFSFYGLMLIPLLLRFNYSPLFKRSLSLAVKIQLLLIGLIFLTLLAFSWGSGTFVRNQYKTYTLEAIGEKLNSLEMEVQNKLGGSTHLSITKDGNFIELLLQRMSKVFKTDINMYDRDGFLLASSRARVFNVGLISEQMNALALNAFQTAHKSEFHQEEQIGKLNYASAYQPFYNNDGQLLGYLNLQHFGQQQEFVDQIQSYLEAIINVFMLLLAVSIVLALFISNWVTAPLKILHENFTSIRFGKQNQTIDYDKEDEIGVLVKDYNQKLVELEAAALQLARNERESAWREMAKQVAHEIKNPLTPMKLSIQHLLRVYDPQDPESLKKLQKVANSIIEQIDGLTKIANEFSNFAKMPLPDFNQVDLVPLIENVLAVFDQESQKYIELDSELISAVIKADKDQLIRVFNNLIKNALQSIPDHKRGVVKIHLSKDRDQYIITIRDNGIGIPESEKLKIFVPYFTTKSTGTGLGLAMVKQMVENHGGQISFESEEGKGTTFTIALPISD